MDAPECPVCLDPYDALGTVPRVLPCGHTVCEGCLSCLPPLAGPPPGAARCPVCNHIIPLSRPSALPRNIDLLRFSPSPNPNPKPKPPPPAENLLPPPWAGTMYARWKDWILPEHSLSLSLPPSSTATVTSSTARPWFLEEGQQLTLFPLSPPFPLPGEECVRFGYSIKLLSSLRNLTEQVGGDLDLVLEASVKLRRSVCRVYGLWIHSSSLYLASQRLGSFVDMYTDQPVEEKKGVGMVGLEMCEAVMDLHSQGIACGCLGMSSFCLDKFGHCVIDLIGVFATGTMVCGGFEAPGSEAFVSPEVFLAVRGQGAGHLVGYESDVWSLACILIALLVGDASVLFELYDGFWSASSDGSPGDHAEAMLSRYGDWMENVVSEMEALLSGSSFEPLVPVLVSCFDYDPRRRPQMSGLWSCMRNLFAHSYAHVDISTPNEACCCLVLSGLCSSSKEMLHDSSSPDRHGVSDHILDTEVTENGASKHRKDNTDIVDGALESGFRSATLRGHSDCVTGLVVGGGFLFSSSFDKSIHVWSLQDFSHVHILRGHEHRITAIIVGGISQPFCASGDSGNGIFIWNIGESVGEEPVKSWYEHNDWRFSGIHSLALSETGYLYSGSADKSIKAWDLQNYSLSCTMSGHKSTVSSLVVSEGILYSGSWDGTIRMWWIHDHSPVAVLESDSSEVPSPVLSLKMNRRILVASYENGSLKVWRNNAFVQSMQIQEGAIFALDLGEKLIFSGGWNKIVHIQELSENEISLDVREVASIESDSIITSLLYWDAKLLVGFLNKEIKVYYCGK